MTSTPKKRLCHIDIIECFAIFCVVIYHSSIYSTDFLSAPSVSTYLSYFYETIMSACVPLFFFANGYLLFHRPFNLKKHIQKMIRIVLIIFVWCPICISTLMIIRGEPLNISTIVNHTLYLKNGYGANMFWYLNALFCIYLLYPALKALYDSNKPAFVFFTILCAVFTFGVVLINQILTFVGVVTHHNFNPVDYTALLNLNPFRNSYGYSFVYFCVGGLAFHYEDLLRAVPRVKRNILSVFGIFASCTMLFLVGVFYSKYVDHDIWSVGWNGIDTIFTFGNVIFLYILSLNYTKDHPFIRTISQNTLGIYITHNNVIWLTYSVIASFSFMYNPLMVTISSFFVVCFCLALCFVIKKIPILKHLI